MRIWQNGCLVRILREDFDQPIERDVGQGPILPSGFVGITYGINAGDVSQPSCIESSGDGGNNSALYFRGMPVGEGVFRRSLVIVMRNYVVGSCRSPDNIDREFFQVTL